MENPFLFLPVDRRQGAGVDANSFAMNPVSRGGVSAPPGEDWVTPAYVTSLIGTESGGNWAAKNNETGAGGKKGHFGRVQFGHARLQEAMNAGAIPQGTTPEQFMASPELQMAAEAWHFADLERQLSPLVGSVVNGQTLDLAALVAMGHLGGAGGARKYVQSNGAYNPSDSFGTSLSDYAKTHSGAGGASGGWGQDNALAAPTAPKDPQNALAEPPKGPQMAFAPQDASAFMRQPTNALAMTQPLQYQRRSALG